REPGCWAPLRLLRLSRSSRSLIPWVRSDRIACTGSVGRTVMRLALIGRHRILWLAFFLFVVLLAIGFTAPTLAGTGLLFPKSTAAPDAQSASAESTY